MQTEATTRRQQESYPLKVYPKEHPFIFLTRCYPSLTMFFEQKLPAVILLILVWNKLNNYQSEWKLSGAVVNSEHEELKREKILTRKIKDMCTYYVCWHVRNNLHVRFWCKDWRGWNSRNTFGFGYALCIFTPRIYLVFGEKKQDVFTAISKR